MIVSAPSSSSTHESGHHSWTPHTLRMTLATRLCEANVPLVQAQRILRHSTPVLTANVYTRPVSTDLRAALNRVPSPVPCTRPVHESGLFGASSGLGWGQERPRRRRGRFLAGTRRTGRRRPIRARRGWGDRGDSNPRPSEPQSDALTN